MKAFGLFNKMKQRKPLYSRALGLSGFRLSEPKNNHHYIYMRVHNQLGATTVN